MGLFNTLAGLLVEGSDESFEHKMNSALDTIEKVLGTTVDKAEHSIKKIDTAGKVIEQSVQKIERVNATVIDSVQKKLPNNEV